MIAGSRGHGRIPAAADGSDIVAVDGRDIVEVDKRGIVLEDGRDIVAVDKRGIVLEDGRDIVAVDKRDIVLEDRPLVYYLLPAYNEEENIGALLARISGVMDEAGEEYLIIVVDDGSQDRTAEIVESAGESMRVHLIRHPVNKGLHESLRSGMAAFLELTQDEGDVLIAMDADNTHEPSSCPEMIRLIREEGYDVVVASRYRPGSREVGLSASRLVMSRVVNLMLGALFRIEGIRDYTCGFRAYGMNALARAWRAYGDRLIESTTFSATAEILLKMGRVGIRATEVPFVLRYDRKGGASKMRVFATILDYFRMMVRVYRSPVQIGAGE